jgi:hypothetical protein
MEHGQASVPPNELSICQLAEQHLYEPGTSKGVNLVIGQKVQTHAHLTLHPRGWNIGSTVSDYSFLPVASYPTSDQKAYTLGTRMVEEGLGWDGHTVQYVSYPKGYVEWGVCILNHHSFCLKGEGENTDYISGAIYCSLGQYEVSPSLLQSLLERWNPNTNTFIFPSGERTVTLLDMLLMSGLPVVGDPYEEYVPSVNDLKPSKLIFPNFLCDMLEIFYELSRKNKNRVTFQIWCDYFHNNREHTSSFESLREQHMYVAAFIAQWLCCYVVVDGTTSIRPGVLLMSSWIVSGRKISLAPPALCSLYYSLWRISTHPVAPSYEKRAWPVHHIAGWMGLYLKKPFQAKAGGKHLPKVKALTMRPTLINTMFRAPKIFGPTKARDLLQAETHNKTKWNPYTSLHLVGVDQLQRAFVVSSHRGMLPWRCATDVDDLCIAEPYHPDRVARQFTLRQQIPYNPLVSLYTTTNTGVAYTYWSHLLRHNQEDFQYSPREEHEALCTVAWMNWWGRFISPFNEAFNALSQYISNGENYHSKKRKFLRNGERFMIPRELSEADLVVVQEVTVRGQGAHVAAIKGKEKEITDRWYPILSSFLSSDKPHVDGKKVSYVYII